MPRSPVDDPLSREILPGQRLRAAILAGILALAAGMLGLLVLAELLGRDVAAPPPVVPFLAALLAAHQLGLRTYIDRALRDGRRVPERFWYGNALAEVSLVTAMIWVISLALTSPVHSVLSPAVYLYFIFIILSTLRVDFATSLFTGVVAGLQYALLSIHLLGRSTHAPVVEPALATPFPFLIKGVMLAGAGLAAAFVARELRERISGAVTASLARDRAELDARAKATFLANMSHEIRTPLNAIVGYAELLEKDASLDGEQRHAVATMHASGTHLLDVIDQVLDLSRIEAGREAPDRVELDLDALADELAGMFRLRCERSGIAWRAEVTTRSPCVRGDRVRLRQVLINLLGNAIRLTDSGEVALEVTDVGDGRCRFAVTDTGPGVPAADQARIFEPFSTDGRGHGRSGRGSGLGLAIAHAQVRLMGGALEVESAPGDGARFHFAIPLEPLGYAAATAAPGPVARLAAGRAVSALVVDDDAVNRELLARMLRRIGVQARQAAGGEDALALVAASTPDVVFLDLRMPGLSGAQTLERMAGIDSPVGTKVIAVSASALAHERQACLDAGFDAFLARPVVLDRLYDCLAGVLGVEYEREPAPGPGAGAAGASTARVVPLPEPLWRALRDAAAGYNITDLRRHLTELEALGDGARPLAEDLRRLSRGYDMEAILEALDEVPCG